MTRVEINGQIVEFPPGMTDQEIEAAAAQIHRQMQAEQQQAPAPNQRMRSFAQGMMDPIYGASQLLERAVPEGVREKIDTAGHALSRIPGIAPPHPEGVTGQLREREEQYQAGRAREGLDPYRMAGNVAAGLPAASGMPAGASLAGRMALGGAAGAASGAMQPALSEEFWPEKRGQAAVGGVAGGAMPAVTGAAARVVSPKASTNPDLALLRREGVTPTGAQTAGGIPKTLEEQARSVPGLGHAIANRQGKALQQFNRAAINRAVDPVGGRVARAGQAGVDDAHRILDQAYDTARASLKGPVLVTNNMRQGIDALAREADTLTDSMQRRFMRELNKGVGKRMQQMTIDPSDYKVIDSKLGKLARDYGKSTDTTQRELGDLFAGLRSTLREGLEAQNPEAAQLFRQADTGWAQLRVVEDAAARAANNAGVFTPGQLTMAVRSADASVSRSATARGVAPMQDLATAGQNVLGNKYPDSGTAARNMLGAGGAGGLITNPEAMGGPAMGLAGMTGGYLGMNPLLRGAISHRPQGAPAAAELLRQSGTRLAPATGLGAAGLLDDEEQYR